VANSQQMPEPVQARAKGGPVLQPVVHPPLRPCQGRSCRRANRQDWLLFILIQSCKSQELRKKIFDLYINKVTLPNVLALARKYQSTEVACADKENISNIFIKKEKRGGKATPSRPVQQPQAMQCNGVFSFARSIVRRIHRH
jgi:hypothetical protein